MTSLDLTLNQSLYLNWLEIKSYLAHDDLLVDKLFDILSTKQVSSSPYLLGTGEMHSLFGLGQVDYLDKPLFLALRAVTAGHPQRRIVTYSSEHLLNELARFEEAHGAIMQQEYQDISSSYGSSQLHSLHFVGVVSWLKKIPHHDQLQPKYALLTQDISQEKQFYVGSQSAGETAGVWTGPPIDITTSLGTGSFLGEYFIDPVKKPKNLSLADKYMQEKAIFHLGIIE